MVLWAANLKTDAIYNPKNNPLKRIVEISQNYFDDKAS